MPVYFGLLPVTLGALGFGIGVWENNTISMSFGACAIVCGLASMWSASRA